VRSASSARYGSVCAFRAVLPAHTGLGSRFDQPSYYSVDDGRRRNGIVGWLVYGGCNNWFYDQWGTARNYYLGGYVNNWWATTLADNGRYGWVPEVYFRGGEDFEADAGLFGRRDPRPAAYCGQWVP
jgi:hypothetical protein